jgi:hypothetical protein
MRACSGSANAAENGFEPDLGQGFKPEKRAFNDEPALLF